MNKQEYLAKRNAMLAEAENLLNDGKFEEYQAKEKEIKALDQQYEDYAKNQANLNALKGSAAAVIPAILDEGDGGVAIDNLTKTNPVAEDLKVREARGNALKANNAVTVASSGIVLPKHSASDIKPTFNEVSSLIDRVNVKQLPGGESFEQPYLKGYGTGDYAAENANYAAAEPVFGKAQIAKAKVTAYAEDSEEIKRLPAADYDGTVMNGMTVATRKKITREILVGDGTTNHLVGIFSTAATAIDAATDLGISEIDETTLDNIVFSYGGDEDVEDAAVLVLNKKDLKAFAKLRSTDGKKLHNIVTNGNSGTIDGIPFLINSACKAISDAATTVGQFGMAYGPLSNYTLAVFSDLEVQRSTDYKFQQGMIAHRGSIFIGGNVTSSNGFLRVKKVAAV